MKKLMIPLAALFTLPLFADTVPKVIYGPDNRYDVYKYPDKNVRKLADMTAALIKKSKISIVEDRYDIPETSWQSLHNVCSYERFAAQPAAAFCSGFLVAPNIMVTAGHCIKNRVDCENTAFVFGYKMADESRYYGLMSDIWSCKRILGQEEGGSRNLDYAVIELDKPASESVLAISSNKTLKAGDPLLVIGHPMGLPTKISDGAKVRSVSSTTFNANLDTYGGNSGSPVINAITHQVEGILVRGETDMVETAAGCNVSNRISDTGGKGETVTLISQVYLNGVKGDGSYIQDDSKYRYNWDPKTETCDEWLGRSYMGYVDNSYCGKK